MREYRPLAPTISPWLSVNPTGGCKGIPEWEQMIERLARYPAKRWAVIVQKMRWFYQKGGTDHQQLPRTIRRFFRDGLPAAWAWEALRRGVKTRRKQLYYETVVRPKVDAAQVT